MRQYNSFKEQYPDYILFFRMGDFYEMFYEDAKIASRELGLALTSRSKGASAIPLAGIPYHALDSYLARLIRAGHRVAICEQVEDAKDAVGVVKRDVTRLVTPGTLTDETLLEQREGNYLVAVFIGKAPKGGEAQAGVAWVELSSGTFSAMIAPADHALDEIVRIRPAEVLVAEGSSLDTREFRDALTQCTGASACSRPPWAFDAHAAGDALKDHFKTTTLEGFGFDGWDESISAAGAIIEYLRETQKTALGHISSLRKFDRAGHMVIDGNTLRCLEITRTLRSNHRAGSLLACLDRTSTGMGARLLERWLTFPLTRYSDIVARQDAVEELTCDRRRLADVRELLSQTSQIDRIASNIAMCRVRPRELVALGQTLATLPNIAQLISGCASELISQMDPRLAGLDEPGDVIETAIDPDCPNVLRDGGVIRDGYHEELDRLRQIGSDGKSWLATYQAQQAKALGVSNLKVGYNKVFGYYIELSHANREKAPPEYHRKQTLKNAERYITDELKKYETEVLGASERARTLEQQLFEEVRRALCEYIAGFQAAAAALAELDVLCGLAQLAVERGYNRPEITQDNILNIVAGRHPVLDQQLREQLVPNDVQMQARDDRLLIITGPNMAGKSTYIRQVALLVLMAQTGSFIPADEAVIGLTDRIFTRVGAADELTRGLSTFMLEMVETANILNNATARSLVILDEVGRGTSTCDGLALAWAICEYIALHVKCRTLFATHYHELTQLEELLDGTTNLNVTVREWADEVVFLHKIVTGGTDQSYGVHVARLAGVPKEAIDRAKVLLPQLQANVANGLNMPELAKRAQAAAAQMQLFADPATRVAGDLKAADLDNMTPLEALDFLRKLKSEL
ncbi:MAG: DNA mismatch repair protein MutS [Phycisphaerae bacterium]|jgi:DNA mismatch repair protein MutS|nr:DNA mismatch repair protein MutS [Phycisphaerae bacterium]